MHSSLQAMASKVMWCILYRTIDLKPSPTDQIKKNVSSYYIWQHQQN